MTTILSRPTRTAAAFALLAVTAAGCADDGQEPTAAPTPTTAASPSQLSLAVASYDLAVGEDHVVGVAQQYGEQLEDHAPAPPGSPLRWNASKSAFFLKNCTFGACVLPPARRSSSSFKA